MEKLTYRAAGVYAQAFAQFGVPACAVRTGDDALVMLIPDGSPEPIILSTFDEAQERIDAINQRAAELGLGRVI